VPSSKRSENVTPLVIARRQGHATCVSVLTGEPFTAAVSWKMVFNAIRDEPDETARAKLHCFLEKGTDSANQHIDSKMLDSFGEHAGFTLAHLAAAKAKLQCFALLNDAGADMTIKELSGMTPTDLSVMIRPETRPPPVPITWQQAFTAVRDADESKALAVVGAFVHGQPGQHLHSAAMSGPDSGRTLASVAADRGFRRVLHVLAQHGPLTPPAPAPRRTVQSTQKLLQPSSFRADWRRTRPVHR
jgi:ankyrin repeat protein